MTLHVIFFHAAGAPGYPAIGWPKGDRFLWDSEHGRYTSEVGRSPQLCLRVDGEQPCAMLGGLKSFVCQTSWPCA